MRHAAIILAGAVSLTLAACDKPKDDAAVANETAEQAAKADRERARELAFDAWARTVYREPWEGGKYIVNGDTPILDRKQLEEFWKANIQREPGLPGGSTVQLIVHRVGGLDAVWNAQEKRSLTYCVSTSFGAWHDKVASDMAAATRAWEQVADVDFTYRPEADAACTLSNGQVTFDVNPVNAGGQYLARAFFPNEPRYGRNVLIDGSSFALDPSDSLQLAGILRHELGHALGFRHEHTRPEAGRCFEDADWRPLTDYDALSVMHYPQCNGLGDWTLSLSNLDKIGAACLYEAAQGFEIDPTVCPGKVPIKPAPVTAQPQTVRVDAQQVSLGQQRQYGPYDVAPGTVFEARMTGIPPYAGDPDLYVWLWGPPSTGAYDCRPYLSGADERCAINIPAGRSQAWVMVRGYRAGRYSLTVTHTALEAQP